jgi:hypothetical protein
MLYIIGGLIIFGVGFFLFKNLKAGLKKTKDLNEERRNVYDR